MAAAAVPPPGPAPAQAPDPAAAAAAARKQELAELATVVGAAVGAAMNGSKGSKPPASFLDRAWDGFCAHPFKYAAGAICAYGTLVTYASSPTIQKLAGGAATYIGDSLVNLRDKYDIKAIPPILAHPILQVGLTSYAYEWLKDSGKKDKDAGSKEPSPTIPKRVALAAIIISADMLGSQGWAGTFLTHGLLSPARNTATALMAVDYLNAAIRDGVAIPKNVVSLANDVYQKTKQVTSWAWNSLKSTYKFAKDPNTKAAGIQAAEATKDVMGTGFQAIYENAEDATIIGTAAAVWAAASGLPGLAVPLALTTAVPIGFVCERLFPRSA